MCASLRLSISDLLSLHMNPPLVLPYVLYAVNNDSSMQDGLSLCVVRACRNNRYGGTQRQTFLFRFYFTDADELDDFR